MHDRPRKSSWKTKEAEEQGLQHDLTANHWGQKEGIVFGHVHLSDIYGPVPVGNWPTGLDRGITTQCLEWAQQHSDQYPDLTTEDWNWVVEQLGVAARVPVLPTTDQVNLDTDAVVRFRQTHHRDKPLPR
ncbi:hypothetical protein AC578_9642 [Pseudocercospora eumusae]|uniref:Uncharacterized protein n=1 Tax=Pseudocercospora eumusae TaxID=321146 RepID=A0A139H177_9PEZI|nr:hypothetical protein AC578_9642 [Pseudocercospora eumusae]